MAMLNLMYELIKPLLEATMYLDTVVIAGLAVVAATCLFFGGFLYAIRRDIKMHQDKEK